MTKSNYLNQCILAISTCLVVSVSYADYSSEVVAKIGKEVITSRRVIADTIFELHANPKKQDVFKDIDLRSDFFQNELNRYLIERAVYLESRSFSLIKVLDEDVSKTKKQILTRIKKDSTAQAKWKELALSNEELTDLVRQRLAAEKFIEFKSRSSYVPVTEAEAFNYYQNNKAKFTKEYKDIKDSIKKNLAKAQAQERLQDWYDILKKKYDIIKTVSFVGS